MPGENSWFSRNRLLSLCISAFLNELLYIALETRSKLPNTPCNALLIRRKCHFSLIILCSCQGNGLLAFNHGANGLETQSHAFCTSYTLSQLLECHNLSLYLNVPLPPSFFFCIFEKRELIKVVGDLI